MSLVIRSKSGLGPGRGRIFDSTALALALFLSACGGGSSEVIPDQYGGLSSAGEVLAAAHGALSSVISYRSETYMVAKNRVDGPILSMVDITLTWSAPDRIHMRFEVAREGEEEQ